MHLQSLQLSNIRSYKSLSLKFPEGIVLFQGDIGSGKSTILMAIEFALFGLGSIKADALLTKGSQRGEVLLTFEVDNIPYEIGREIIKTKGGTAQSSKNSFLCADGVREPLTPTDLKPRVLNILKFREPPNVRATSRVFRYAIYTPQEEIKSILYGREREDTIRRAFGMEDYNIAADNARNIIQSLKDRMTRIGDPTERLDIMKSRLAQTRDKTASVKDDLTKLELQKEQLDRQRITADSELSEARKKMDAYQRLQAEYTHTQQQINDGKRSLKMHQATISSNKSQMASLQGQLDRHPDAPPPTTRSRSEINQTIQAMREKLMLIQKQGMLQENCHSQIRRLKALMNEKSIEDVRNEMMQLQRSLSSDQAEAEYIRDNIEKARMNRGEHTQQIKSLWTALSRAQNLKDRCEYCNNVLEPSYVQKLTSERRAQLAKAREELATVDAEIMAFEKDRTNTQSNIEKTRRRINDIRHVEKVADDLRRYEQESLQAARLKEKAQADYDAIPYLESGFGVISGESSEMYLKRLETALVKHMMARDRRISLQNQISTVQNSIEQNKVMCASDLDKIRQKKERLDEINSEMASYGSIYEILKKCEVHLDNLDGQIKSVSIRVAHHEAKLEGLTRQENGLVSDIQTAQNDLDLYRTYEDHIEWLKKFFIPSLEAIETRALNLLRHEFNKFYQEWYKVLVDDPTKSSYVDERFGPVVEQDGYEQDVDSLSGGEKTGVALAFRLALNSTMREQAALPDTNIIILDEPTDGFSRDQMQKVSDILKSIDSNQIIMVSHERELEDYAEHRFRVIKTDGVSTIERLTY